MNSTPPDFRYWAYIAYAPDAGDWDRWLHHSLETFPIPRILVGQPMPNGTVPKRLYPVFRDKDELPAAANLGDQIEWALRQSRHLVVLCTPGSAKSPEVDRQIRFFKSLGREAHVTCLLVDAHGGSPPDTKQSLVPEAARGACVVDARKGHGTRQAAKLGVVARILGVGLNDLIQRDRERTLRRMQLIMVSVGMLFTVFSLLAVNLFMEKSRADNWLREAEYQRALAELARQQAISAKKVAVEASRKAKETQASPTNANSTSGLKN